MQFITGRDSETGSCASVSEVRISIVEAGRSRRTSQLEVFLLNMYASIARFLSVAVRWWLVLWFSLLVYSP